MSPAFLSLSLLVSSLSLTSLTSLVGCCLVGCEEEPGDPEPTSSSEESNTPGEPLLWLDLNGRVSIKITPQEGRREGPLTLYNLSRLPNSLQLSLPKALNTSGVVTVADDPASTPSAINADAWVTELRSTGEPLGLLGVLDDLDPLSPDLFLFSLPPRRSISPLFEEEGEARVMWQPSRYLLWLAPQGLPPYNASVEASERLTLNLPTRLDLHTHRLKVLTTPYSSSPLTLGRVVVTQEGRQVSALQSLNASGEVTLSWWTSALSRAPLTFTLLPGPPLSQLTARFKVSYDQAPELFEPGETTRPDPLSLPSLRRLQQLSVALDGDDEELWVSHLTQRWGSQILSGDPLDPALSSRLAEEQPRLRVAAQWEAQAFLSARDVAEVSVFEREALLTLQPPVSHPARTVRIELSSVEGDLSVSPVLKQRLLGQVSGPSGQVLEGVSLYALQRAWPWPDTPHLRLGERWSMTSSSGALDLALDPGQYALRLSPPPALGLAPRVLLAESREVGDVSLDRSSLSLSEGMVMRVQATDELGEPLQGRVSVWCELPEPTELNALATTLSPSFEQAHLEVRDDLSLSPPPRLLLISALLNERGEAEVRVSAESCPALPSEEEDASAADLNEP
jgi:hypothetical protein